MSENVENQVQGPEIMGTRLTVYHLLDSFLDPRVTESEICRVYQLSAEQVAAARAFVLRNPDTVLAQHLKIEERLSAGNPAEVRESAERAKATFKRFREWLAERQTANHEEEDKGRPGRLPTFKEWLAEQEQR
jgi:uncharacterized protein (DUF433 family)